MPCLSLSQQLANIVCLNQGVEFSHTKTHMSESGSDDLPAWVKEAVPSPAIVGKSKNRVPTGIETSSDEEDAPVRAGPGARGAFERACMQCICHAHPTHSLVCRHSGSSSSVLPGPGRASQSFYERCGASPGFASCSQSESQPHSQHAAQPRLAAIPTCLL